MYIGFVIKFMKIVNFLIEKRTNLFKNILFILMMHCRSIKLMNIERLLWIAEVYVLNVEENHHTTRIILPHGASFHGLQINLMITCESPKQEFILLVSRYSVMYMYVD